MAEANLNYQTIRTTHAAREAVRVSGAIEREENVASFLLSGRSTDRKPEKEFDRSRSPLAGRRRVTESSAEEKNPHRNDAL